MTAPNLPGAIVSHPDCGACYKELEYEDGEFFCSDCQIQYSANSPEDPAEYVDPSDKPCGHPAATPPYEKNMDATTYSPSGTWRFWDDPCSLPAGHTSDHWHYGHAERLTTDKEPDSE